MSGWGASAWGTDPWGDPPVQAPTVLASGHPATLSQAITTSSVSPGANHLLIFSASVQGGATDLPVPTLAGLGLTWTLGTKGTDHDPNTRDSFLFWAVTGGSPPTPGTLTLSSIDPTQPNGRQVWYHIVEFGDDVDITDPIIQPRGYSPWSGPPDYTFFVNQITHEMSGFADPLDSAYHWALVGQSGTSITISPSSGSTLLTDETTASIWHGYGEFHVGETANVNTTWTGTASHYISVGCEIRHIRAQAGGRIKDRWLDFRSDATDGTTIVTNRAIDFHADGDIWYAVTASRSGAVPGQPTITDSNGGTWNLIDEIPFSTTSTPTYKMWLFQQRSGASTPTPMTITATFPQTQLSRAFVVFETTRSHATGPVRQTVHASANNTGSAGFAVPFAAAVDNDDGVYFWVAKAQRDRLTDRDLRSGTAGTGYAFAGQATTTPTPISIVAFGRTTRDDVPSIILRADADYGFIAVEVREENQAADAQTVTVTSALDATPTIYTPKLNKLVQVGLISVVPTIFTPVPSGNQRITGGGAFQQNAFQDDAFQMTDSLFVDASPTLFQFEYLFAPAQVILTPSPVATDPAFQPDTFQDDTFQTTALASTGINHAPQLLTMTLSSTVAEDQFVILAGGAGWDSDNITWDATGHLWDEGNIGGIVLHAPQLFTPALPFKLTFPLLDATPTIYAPSAAPKTILLPLLNAVPTVFIPQMSQLVTVDLLDATPTIFTPGFPQPVVPALLDAVAVLYAPSVNPQEIDPDIILVVPTVYTPDLSQAVSPALLDATPTLYAPFVGVVLFPGLIDASPVLYEPSLAPVMPALLDATPEIFTPEVVAKIPQTVRLEDASGLIDISAVALEPEVQLAPPQTVEVGFFIDGTPLLLAPHVIVPTRPTIVLHARYDPITVLHARYVPVILKHAQNTRQGG